MEEKHLTLSALAARLSESVAAAFPREVWVVAEVSECKVGGSGHCYLSLVERTDDGSTRAEMRAAIWASKYRLIEGYFRQATGLNIQAGLKILVRASVGYHPVYGLSLNISDIEPSYTVGEGERQRRATIERLEKEGLMELQREFALPLVAQRFAVVSSPTAAGYEDFMKHLDESPYRIETELFEAAMQGEATERSVVEALGRIEARGTEFDAVVVMRGGGSASDLRWFDSYGLCAALARCTLPVLTGIGHEKDTSVADMVAYHAFKTPTAAAAGIVERIDKVYNRFENLWAATLDAAETVLGNEAARLDAAGAALGRWTAEVLRGAEGRLERLRSALVVGASGAIEERKRRVGQWASAVETRAGAVILQQRNDLAVRRQRIDAAARTVLNASTNRLSLVQGALSARAGMPIDRARSQLARYAEALRSLSGGALERQKARLTLLGERIEGRNPRSILSMGYAIAKTADGRALKHAADAPKGTRLTLELSDGTVKTEVI